tara:strand:- start:125 stop:391 length:267 start_codon:yes stop_codon:yes gene_type:complete
MDKNTNFNVLALQGADIDDMEYIEQFKLDPKLAYTPGINDAMLDTVRDGNLEFFRSEGNTEKDSLRMANEYHSSAKAMIKRLLKNMVH